MKRLLIILILTFSFHTLTKADDIRDFQIEGMSIGDSLLDYFDKNEIKKEYVFPNKKFATHYGVGSNFKVYEGYQIFYLTNDPNYIIHYLSGKILYENNTINKCYKKMYEIAEEMKDQITSAKYSDNGKQKNQIDKTGKSVGHNLFFNFDDGSEIAVSCLDNSKEMQKEGTHTDNLSVNIRSKEFTKWLNTDEAYK